MQRYQKFGVAKNLHEVLPKGVLNFTDEQISKLRNVGEVLLALSAFAGIATVALVAPNALQLINKLPWARRTYKNLLSKNREQQKAIARGFYYIKQNSYAELIEEKGQVKIKITAKGRKKIKAMNFNFLSVPKTQWDGKWWFVLADIPTKECRYAADLFRNKLKQMNFFPLQRTVWVYPNDPRDEIDFISSLYKIYGFVTVLQAAVVDSDDEKKLKTRFKNLKLI